MTLFTVPERVPEKKLSPTSRLVPIPTVRIKVHCGCGVNFTSILDGAQHATETNHSLTITGEIRSVKI